MTQTTTSTPPPVDAAREGLVDADRLQLARAVAVDAVLARYYPRGDRDHVHQAEAVVDIVLATAGPLVAAAAGRMTIGGYGAHWETCWRLHADCAVLHATALQREAHADEVMLGVAGDVAAERHAEAALLRGLLREVAVHSHRLPPELEDRVHRAADVASCDVTGRLAALADQPTLRGGR